MFWQPWLCAWSSSAAHRREAVSTLPCSHSFFNTAAYLFAIKHVTVARDSSIIPFLYTLPGPALVEARQRRPAVPAESHSSSQLFPLLASTQHSSQVENFQQRGSGRAIWLYIRHVNCEKAPRFNLQSPRLFPVYIFELSHIYVAGKTRTSCFSRGLVSTRSTYGSNTECSRNFFYFKKSEK